jgi:hypothetical protein
VAISVGSVSVDVVPDTRGFATDLKAKLKGVVAEIGVRADTAELRAQLDEVTRDRRATINVDADTALAESRIDFAARDRRASISVSGLDTFTSGLSDAARGVSGLGLAIAILGPTLIPITAAVVGLGAALVAPLALAGGGLTIGALLGGFAIKGTLEQKKQIDDLAKKVEASRLALSKATTPAGRRSAQLQLAADTQAYMSALAALSPVQSKFLDSVDRLKSSFKGLVTSTGGALFEPFIKGMDLLAKIMPSLRPLIVSVSRAVGVLLDDLGKAASGPGFKAFIRSFGKSSGAAIVSFGRIFGNFAKGFIDLFRAFGPVSAAFSKGLAGSAKSFAAWARSLGASKSFQSFLGYVKDVGPKVADALGHMFQAIGRLSGVLAPLGGLVLTLVDGLSKLIINAKPAEIAKVAGALGGLAIALAVVGGPVIAIPAALLAVGGALAFAYKHSEPFRNAIAGIGRVFTEQIVPAVKHVAEIVLPKLTSGFDSVRQSIKDNQGLFDLLGQLFKGLGKALLEKVLPAIATLYSTGLPLLGKAIGVAVGVVSTLVDAFLNLAEFGLRSFRFLVNAALSTFGAILTAADKGLGWIPGIGDKIHGAKKAFDDFKDDTVASLDAAIGKVIDLQDTLHGLKPKTVEIRLKVTEQQLVLNPSLGKPRVTPEGFGAAGAIINRPTVLLAGETHPEALIPLNQTPGNQPLPNGLGGGPQFNVEKVVAQDVNDFLRQMQVRARAVGIGGMPA